jgi:hypothetical protein
MHCFWLRGTPFLIIPTCLQRRWLFGFAGLACLRWHQSGIYFGARDAKTKWDPGKTRELVRLFRELPTPGHPLASDTRHPLFRAPAERWLEFLIRQDVTRVDPSLDPLFAYAQVLAGTVGDTESWTFCLRRAPVAWPSSN